MKNSAKDIEDNIDLSEAAFKKRFRRLPEDELPPPVQKRREAARKKLKNRVTIYFDADIVDCFKKMSESEGVGYQTLMNEALRTVTDGITKENSKAALKEELLKDKKFLRRLKTALTA